ncbi:MAG: hypothetical protein AB8B59_18620 [Maribacter sp.]
MDKEELINGYFENSLSPDQLTEFEQLLKKDSEFSSEVDFQKELRVSLKKNERQEIKQMFSESNTDASKTEIKVFRLRPWLAAASIALLIGLGSWMLFFNNPEVNTDQLYASNFAPYDNVVHPIERGSEIEDLKTKMFAAYEAQDYELWLALSSQMTTTQKDDYIDFYSAIVYMELDNHEKAIPLLSSYINDNGELDDRATWYLALSHLKLGEIEKSKEALKILVEMESFKKKDAENLLENLN